MDDAESLDPLDDWLDEKDSFYDSKDVPSWERLAQAGNIFKRVLKCHDSERNPSPELVKDLIAAALMLSENADHKQLAVKVFAIGLNELEELASDYPEIAQRLIGVTVALMIGSQSVIAGNAMERHKGFSKRMDPLVKANAPKAAAIERAKAIAAELWQADAAQAIRVGEMADRVYRALVSEGFTEELPGSADRVKEWIKPDAPAYARKGGRRRKTS